MENRILLGHGSGGKLTRNLVKNVFIDGLKKAAPESLDDGAILPVFKNKTVFTTDSYVVDPLEFPGGDIGTLAVSGTVNDLAVMGAKPHFLSLGVILEEGLEIELLERIVKSISDTAQQAGVQIVVGDTKVVEKGKGDGVFLNTSGIGELIHPLCENKVEPGDKILINGTVGDHGFALLTQRKGFPLDSDLKSDCGPLNDIIQKVSEKIKIKWMTDPTRGGVATVLNEFVENKDWGISIEEARLPLHKAVEGLSEILGLDPLYSANEGKVLMAVSPGEADEALAVMKKHPMGKKSAVIGEISKEFKGKLVLKTQFDTLRTIGMLNSDPLPRIC